MSTDSGVTLSHDNHTTITPQSHIIKYGKAYTVEAICDNLSQKMKNTQQEKEKKYDKKNTHISTSMVNQPISVTVSPDIENPCDCGVTACDCVTVSPHIDYHICDEIKQFYSQHECCLLAMGIITKWYHSPPYDLSVSSKYVVYELIRQTGISQESALKHVNDAFKTLGWI